MHLELTALREDEDRFDETVPTSDPVPLEEAPEGVRELARQYDCCSFATDLYSLTIIES